MNAVHDIQRAYRKVVDSISRPGLISDLSEEAGKADSAFESFPATWAVARMLLDTEVTFKIYSKREPQITRLINQLTYASKADVEKADYIFVLQDATDEDVLEALQQAKTGSLSSPHDSATIIIESGEISNEPGLSLRGPGIQDESFVQIPLPSDWVEIRAEKNVEYPLGMDIMFIDGKHRLICLPRTTQIVEREV